MQKFYSDYDQVKVRRIKALLDDARIPCFIKNEFIQGAAGELPPHETLPEIWLIDNQWAPRAQAVVDELEANLALNKNDWVCGNCGEVNESQFMVCWKCEKPFVKNK